MKFHNAGSETLSGDAAYGLQRLLAEAQSAKSGSKNNDKVDSLRDGTQPIRLGNVKVHRPISLSAGRKKTWFHRRDETGREFFLSVVNSKGSCSLRSFDGESGIFLGKHSRAGDYQDQFADLIAGATEVTVETQPNLERDCRERLPANVLAYLKQQKG